MLVPLRFGTFLFVIYLYGQLVYGNSIPYHQQRYREKSYAIKRLLISITAKAEIMKDAWKARTE